MSCFSNCCGEGRYHDLPSDDSIFAAAFAALITAGGYMGGPRRARYFERLLSAGIKSAAIRLGGSAIQGRWYSARKARNKSVNWCKRAEQLEM